MNQAEQKEWMNMDTLTELIKKEIKRQYGSVKFFATQTGVPYGTINTALFKGIGGSSFDFVMRVCKLLGIKQIFSDEISQVNSHYYELVNKMETLDNQGIATVTAIINVEADRCSKGRKDEVIKNYNGIGHVDQTDEHIRALIREVLKEQKAESNESQG